MTSEAINNPDYQCAAYAAMLPGWTVWSDVLAGQEAIRAKYLPQEYGEHPDDYKARVGLSLYFEDPRDCMVNLGGMVFRKQPSLRDDVPPLIRQYAENIDNAGTHLNVFLQRLFEDAFYGHSFVVVERPPQSGDVRTLADEIASGARTYWCMRQAKDAVNWFAEEINGQTVLTQITFRECKKEKAGRYGEREVVRYRVYFLSLNKEGNLEARWNLWRESTDDKGVKTFIDEGGDVIRSKAGTPLTRLPIAVHYGEREGYLESRPPLKGVADISIADFRKYADLSYIEHKTCNVSLVHEAPKPEDPDVQIGGNSVIYSGGPGQKLYYLTISGDSIPALERDREMLQKRLVAKGLDFVRDTDSRHPVTATEVTLAYTDRSSKLAKMVRSLRDCAENALQITAEIEGLALPDRGDGGGSITIGVDENSLTLTPDELRVYSEMNTAGQLSLFTLFAMMSRSDRLPEDFKFEDEIARLDEEAGKRAERAAAQFNSGNLPAHLL
jgi:hypothetical protein